MFFILIFSGKINFYPIKRGITNRKEDIEKNQEMIYNSAMGINQVESTVDRDIAHLSEGRNGIKN